MKLGDKERKIVLAAQFRAADPISALSKATGLRSHVIQYHLERLKDQGIIRRAALVDVYRLGMTEHTIYFSLAPERQTATTQLTSFLESSPRVAWFAELGGAFQYAVTVCSQNARELTGFLEHLGRKFGKIVFEKSIAHLVSFSLYRKKYLHAGRAACDSLTFGETAESLELDDTSRRILSAVVKGGAPSGREIARQLGLARTTVDYRLRKLEEDGVILAYVYFVNAARIGMQTFKVLVYAKGLGVTLRSAIHQFAARHPNIVNLTSYLGSWDYELTVEVESSRDMVPVVQDLYSRLGDQIARAEVLPVFRQVQPQSFLALDA